MALAGRLGVGPTLTKLSTVTVPAAEQTRRFAIRVSLAFFCAWLLLQLLAADIPPPRGFLLLILLDLVAASGIYLRIPVYQTWQATRRPRRRWLVMREGAIGGLALALVIMFASEGEPTVTPTWVDRLVWCAVLAALGAANTVLVAICVFVRFQRAP